MVAVRLVRSEEGVGRLVVEPLVESEVVAAVLMDVDLVPLVGSVDSGVAP